MDCKVEIEAAACPWCGMNDVVLDHTKDDSYGFRKSALYVSYEVCCNTCDIAGPSAATEDEAVAAWNTRGKARRGRRNS